MSVKIYQWPEHVLVDESAEEYEYFEYFPVSETEQTLNGIGEIRFSIDSLSTCVHPCKSHIYIVGQILRSDNNTPFDNAGNVALANNGIVHLFSQIKNAISGQPVEDVLNPGVSSTILGMLRYPDDFSKSSGLLQCWYKDDGEGTAADTNNGYVKRKKLFYNSIAGDTAKGSFSFRIPLKHIFGFCEDYTKVMYGVTHTLSLFRKPDGTAIFRAANRLGPGNTDVPAKVVIKKNKWRMPQVKPSLEISNGLISEIENKKVVQLVLK